MAETNTITSGRGEASLADLRKRAEEIAASRRETVNTAHLLPAVAEQPGVAGEQLAARGFTPERLLQVARAATEEDKRAMTHARDRAREFAGRTNSGEATALHLLFALLSDPHCGAYRALGQAGCDVTRMRNFLAGMANSGAAPRRQVAARSSAASAGRRTAQTVSLVPTPAPRPVRTPRPGRSAPQPLSPSPSPPPPLSAAPPSEAKKPKPPSRPVRSPSSLTPRPSQPSKRGPTGGARPAAKLANARGHGPDAKSREHERFELSAKRFPTLTALGTNLTLAAARGELDPVVRRDPEIEQVLDVLAKRHGNNPCIVGAPGVGKTSVVRGLAQRVAEGKATGPLDERILIEIRVGELLAGTGVRGALAQKLGAIRKEVAQADGHVALFFDDVHQLFSGEAAEEIGAELKLALARGELPCIAACSWEDYRRTIENDGALARRFSTVEVESPNRDDAFLMLSALAPQLGDHHGVRYSEEALALSVAWTLRYLPGRALPDKAVNVLDLAGARQHRRGEPSVDREAVAEVVAELADLPISRLLETDADRMLRLEELLAERVIGHEEHLRCIAKILRRNAVGLNDRRPIGTFLLLGPTGVGKTETAKAIAETLFFSEAAMTRIDLSEFSEAHSVARLIGAPPGYVGHEAGGQLTEAVRRRPYQVVLLDEIEKAHPEVLQTFLAAFDEGRLTDGRGRMCDLTNCVFLLTSNIGSREATPQRRVGFGDGAASASGLASRVIGAARQTLPPELYNRLDEVLVYAPLSRDDVSRIAERMLQRVGDSLVMRGLSLEFEAEAVEILLTQGGFEPELGARPMKRAIARLVEAPLAELLLQGAVERGDRILLTARNDEIVVEPARRNVAHV